MSVHPISSLPSTAEEWVARLQADDCSREEHLAFEDWLAADPRNPTVYADAERLYSLSSALSADPQLRAMARGRELHAGTRSNRPWMLATAAGLVLVCLLGYQFLGSDARTPDQRLSTTIGERRDAVLEDGSHVILDADTDVGIGFSRSERTLTLMRGRVQIDAMPDSARPMVVHAGNGSVRVVGTTFQVQQLDGRVEVGLLHGKVTLATKQGRGETLSEGQKSGYDRQGNIIPIRALSPTDAQAWTRGLLVFSDSPLDTILQEANRYSRVKVRLADPRLASIPISGAFQAGDQQALADALTVGWALEAQRDGAGNIVLSRRH